MCHCVATAAGRKCWLLLGMVRERFLEGMTLWRDLGRKLEGHPDVFKELQIVKSLGESRRNQIVKGLLSPDRVRVSAEASLKTKVC